MTRAGAASHDDRCAQRPSPLVLGLKYHDERSPPLSANQSMIPKSGNRFSEEIMLTQELDLDPIQLERIKV
jgi:hypothetical protein